MVEMNGTDTLSALRETVAQVRFTMSGYFYVYIYMLLLQ